MNSSTDRVRVRIVSRSRQEDKHLAPSRKIINTDSSENGSFVINVLSTHLQTSVEA